MVMSISGAGLLSGSSVARFPEKTIITLAGVFTVINVVAGIMHARRKEITQHKQYMCWAVVWSSTAGLLRGFGYIGMFLEGSIQVSSTCSEMTLLPYYCQIVPFNQTKCGIGHWPVFLTSSLCLLVGCTLGKRMGKWYSGAQIGNLIPMVLFVLVTSPLSVAAFISAKYRMLGAEKWETCTGMR